jgi:hypothetical protein
MRRPVLDTVAATRQCPYVCYATRIQRIQFTAQPLTVATLSPAAQYGSIPHIRPIKFVQFAITAKRTVAYTYKTIRHNRFTRNKYNDSHKQQGQTCLFHSTGFRFARQK